MITGFHASVMTGPVVFRPVLILRQQPGVGTVQVDLTSRLMGFDITASLDNATATATFDLSRGKATSSLSPAVVASDYIASGRHILDPNTEVSLSLFADPPDGPRDSTARQIFLGRLDRVNAASRPGEVQIVCRDQGAYWLDAKIRLASKFGTVAGREAFLVMQDLTTTWGGAYGLIPLDLASTAPADFLVQEYPQREMGLLEAFRVIAQQAGRDVRWFQSAGKVLYYDPGRARTTPDLTIGKTRYQDVTELAWGDEDVRNYWDLWYRDAEGVVHGPVHREDAASIARYGLRPARYFLDRAELIRSDAAAGTMLDAVLADSKEPFASHAITAPLLPQVELNDLHLYQANGDHYDTDQLLAVVAYKHSWRAGPQEKGGKAETTVGCRGKPIAAYRQYRTSRAPAVLVSTQPPDDAVYKPEDTIMMQTGSLAFPV